MNEVLCLTCGAKIENRTNRKNCRLFCNSSCRNKHWAAMKKGRETVELKPKKEPGISNWERILARRDPLTHRYHNAPALPAIKFEEEK